MAHLSLDTPLDNCAIVREFIERCINEGEIDEAARFVWEDVVERVPFPGQGPGLAGFQQVLRDLRTAFPDMCWSIDEQMAEDDRVLTRFTWTGTHEAPFFCVPATEKHVTVWGMVIDRFVDGRIRDTRIIMDTLGLMAQLGAIPIPGG